MNLRMLWLSPKARLVIWWPGTGQIRQCQPMADAAGLSTIATAAVNNTAVSEEAAQPSKTTVSQWQTCAEANCVDRDITTSRVKPGDDLFSCGKPLPLEKSLILNPTRPIVNRTTATGDARILPVDAARFDYLADQTVAGDSIPSSVRTNMLTRPHWTLLTWSLAFSILSLSHSLSHVQHVYMYM